MNWFFKTLISSIGKKLVMAATGLIFCGFLAVHLVGNLMIYGGRETFIGYAERLHALGVVINVTELGLLFCALLHVAFALLLYIEDLRARPVGYAVKRYAGGRTFSSATMPYTGLFLLIFVIIHLFTFHFVDRTQQTIYEIAARVFSNPFYVIFYVFAVIVAAFHIKHGFWSAFQSIGANHPNYMPLVRGVSLIFSLVVGIGFASVPVYVLTMI